MAEEKIISINIRKELNEYPKWERSGKAVSIVRQRVARYTKSQNVVLDKRINERLWSRGAKRPDTRIRLKITKGSDSVKAQLME
jgi:large subunit ribosomal protein L31e